MASKKLTPGSSKSSTGGRKASTRRTGRTTGISQSAFAGYAFQGKQPAAKPAAESESESEVVEDDAATATNKPKPDTDGSKD